MVRNSDLLRQQLAITFGQLPATWDVVIWTHVNLFPLVLLITKYIIII